MTQVLCTPLLLFITNILGAHHSSLSTFFYFHHTRFCGLVGVCLNPRSILQTLAFTCLSNNSLISQWISAKLLSALLHVCPTCHTIFSLKETLECVCEKLLHCKLIISITWTPTNDFQKFSNTQSISFCSES